MLIQNGGKEKISLPLKKNMAMHCLHLKQLENPSVNGLLISIEETYLKGKTGTREDFKWLIKLCLRETISRSYKCNNVSTGLWVSSGTDGIRRW